MPRKSARSPSRRARSPPRRRLGGGSGDASSTTVVALDPAAYATWLQRAHPDAAAKLQDGGADACGVSMCAFAPPIRDRKGMITALKKYHSDKAGDDAAAGVLARQLTACNSEKAYCALDDVPADDAGLRGAAAAAAPDAPAAAPVPPSAQGASAAPAAAPPSDAIVIAATASDALELPPLKIASDAHPAVAKVGRLINEAAATSDSAARLRVCKQLVAAMDALTRALAGPSVDTAGAEAELMPLTFMQLVSVAKGYYAEFAPDPKSEGAPLPVEMCRLASRQMLNLASMAAPPAARKDKPAKADRKPTATKPKGSPRRKASKEAEADEAPRAEPRASESDGGYLVVAPSYTGLRVDYEPRGGMDAWAEYTSELHRKDAEGWALAFSRGVVSLPHDAISHLERFLEANPEVMGYPPQVQVVTMGDAVQSWVRKHMRATLASDALRVADVDGLKEAILEEPMLVTRTDDPVAMARLVRRLGEAAMDDDEDEDDASM